MEIYFLISLLAIIQSLFGVGVLLFGTPVLLALGLDYKEVLLYLLPASATLSWGQVYDYRDNKLPGNFRKAFFLICLPLLLLGMGIAAYYDFKWEIKLLVIFMLLVSFALRSISNLRIGFERLVQKSLPLGLGLTGLIHGLSNMGGSLLNPLVSSIYKEKEKILTGVSFAYAFMASSQLFFLILVDQLSFQRKYFIGIGISLIIRQMIGKRVLSSISELNHHRLISGLILVNAVLLAASLV